MPKTKKSANKAAAATGTDTAITTVSVSRKFTISRGDYESVAIQATVTATNHEAASAHLDEVMMLEAEKANAQFEEIAGAAGVIAADLEDDEEEAEDEEEADEEEEVEEEEGEIGPAEVRAMKRSELITLIKENELETDPAEFKGNGALSKLREAIIEEAFGEDEDADDEEEVEDEDDEEEVEDEDEAEEEDEDAEDEEEEEFDLDELDDMKRPALLEFAEEQELEIDEDDFPKNTKGLKALRAAIKEALSEEDEEEEDGEEEEEDDEAEEEEEGYTKAELEELSPDDLKLIFKEWGIGKYPSGAPKKAKKTAITKILKAQDEG